MFRSLIPMLTVLNVALLLNGCVEQPEQNTTGCRNFLRRTFSEEELDILLKVGMSSAEVVAIFGNPFSKSDDLFSYELDFGEKPADEDEIRITGFSVRFKDDKVVWWGLIYGLHKTEVVGVKDKCVPSRSNE